jgi:hypothetical protein
MDSVEGLHKIITVEDYNNGAFDELISNKATFFGYFTGSVNEEGVSWCPDCVTAKPIVKEAIKILEKVNTKILYVELPVERSVWKDQDFIYRTKLKVTNVPTLVFYQKGLEFGRLVESELFEQNNVEEFIKSAIESV